MGLIEKNDNGSWKLKGVEWSQIKPGAVITDQVWEKLYGALWKLKDYEKTGLSPDQVSELQNETQEQARQMLERVARLSDEIERMKGEERQQWIPVTEKLPEPETYILVSFDNFTLPDIATYRVDDDGSGAFYQGDEDYTYLSVGFYVNAWMPLPEPYRSEVEEKRLEDVMRCPYCNYIPKCNEQTCAGCKIYEDFLDDINDLY